MAPRRDTLIVIVTSILAFSLLFVATWLRASAGSSQVVVAATVGRAASTADPVAAARPPPSFEEELDAKAQLGDDLSCHGRRHFDLSGDAAFVWGLSFHVADEVECCQACAAHRRTCSAPDSQGKTFWTASLARTYKAKCGKPGGKLCNAFVYCPDERCFSYTPHNHSRHECWLKHEPNLTHPIAHGPSFPAEMRRAPRKDWPWAVGESVWPGEPPELVQWSTGLVVPRSERVWTTNIMPSWHTKFCTGKYGPCSS